MNKDEPTKLVYIDPARMHGSAVSLAHIQHLYDAEMAGVLSLREESPPFLDLEAAVKLGAIMREAEAYRRGEPRSPWDRGSRSIGLRSKEGLFAMMARVARETKIHWTTPEIEERDICTNCDGAPDGGHAGDEYCIRYWED